MEADLLSWGKLALYAAGSLALVAASIAFVLWAYSKATRTLLGSMATGYGGVINAQAAIIHQNTQQQGQLNEQGSKIVALEKKSEDCEQFTRAIRSIAQQCPITHQPCPLRAFFSMQGN